MGKRTIAGWLLVAGQLALLAVIALAPGAAWRVPALLRALFMLVVLAGAGMIVWGAWALGRQITPHPAPTPGALLRTDGPYRLVRHPIYSGILALGLGLAGASGSPVKAVAFVLLLLLLSVKARFEERLLAERFAGYAAYARKTPRFVPKLRRLLH